MANAKICDVCNGFYKPHEYTKAEKLKFDLQENKDEFLNGRPVLGIDILSINYSERFDLCPGCANKLIEFMTRFKED